MKFLSDILAKAGLTVDGVVTLNNTATGQTPDANDNSTKLATTAWVRTFVQPYNLPIASASVLGGIKVGSGLSIDAGTGVLSAAGSGGSVSFRTIQEFTATAGQDTFTISGGYTVGYIEVFLNGVYLSASQYTATNGSTIVLDDPAAHTDLVSVFLYSLYYTGQTAASRDSVILTATAGQTVFTTPYIPGQVDVFYNGSKLVGTEFTATNGSTITLAQAAVVGDLIEVVTYLATGGVNANRILTINGVSYDLTEDRTWTLTTSNISEGTNLYYTDTRVGSYLTTNSYATQSYVSTQINNLVSGAPGLLDTLDELAAALGDDANFASNVTTALAGKQASLNGTGFVKISGTTISYDNSTYLTTSSASSTYQTILTNPVTGTIASGQVAFGTAANTIGGDNGLFWDNTNKRLGVGTNAPLGKLQITNTNNGNVTTGLYLKNSTGINGGIAIDFDNTGSDNIQARINTLRTNDSNFSTALVFSVNTPSGILTESIRISTSGNLLVGTTTDAGFRLDVNGTARVQGNLNVSTGGVTLTGAQTIQTSTGNLTLASAGGSGDIILSPHSTGNSIIRGNNFAIGGNTINTFSGFKVINFQGLGSGAIFQLGTSTTVYGFIAGTVNEFSVAAQNNVPIKFFTGVDNTISEKARLFVNGNLLLQNGGTFTDAGFRLDVNGTARVQGVLTTTADAVVNGVNIGLGAGSVASNTRVGVDSLQNNTTGISNTANGFRALRFNTTGSTNTAYGREALRDNITGNNNTANGVSALVFNTIGNSNTAFGVSALANNIAGSSNTVLGTNSGRFIADGITALTAVNNSIFIGVDTRANANSQTNQIVIGHNAIGLGSNTTVIGNSSTTFGRWYGSLLLGTTTNAASSILTMESTTQGFLPPRMTTTQRNAIASPATGLVVYQTDGVEGLYVRTSTAWRAITMV